MEAPCNRDTQLVLIAVVALVGQIQPECILRQEVQAQYLSIRDAIKYLIDLIWVLHFDIDRVRRGEAISFQCRVDVICHELVHL